MEEKVIKKMEESITNLLEGGLTTANVDTLYKLSKIKHLAKEDKEMNYGNYGNYEEYRGRYGQGEETDKSFYYMVKALEDFLKVLQEEAETPQQKQQLKQTLEKSMM